MGTVSAVTLMLNGSTYNLTYNSSAANYKATFTAPLTTSYGQADHVYAGIVTVTDTAGNVVSATKADFASLGLRVLEKTAPTQLVVFPTAGAYVVTATPTIQWTVTDTGSGVDAGTIALTIDGTTITSGITKTATANGYSCSYTASALAEGSHTVSFTASDYDGNTASGTSTTFTVDTVPPTLSVTTPVDNLVTNRSSVEVSGTTNDDTSSPVTLTVNGSTVTVNQDGSFATTVNLPSDGATTITVIATDAAGKTTTVTRTVTRDTNAPVIKSVSITPNPIAAGALLTIEVKVDDT